VRHELTCTSLGQIIFTENNRPSHLHCARIPHMEPHERSRQKLSPAASIRFSSTVSKCLLRLFLIQRSCGISNMQAAHRTVRMVVSCTSQAWITLDRESCFGGILPHATVPGKRAAMLPAGTRDHMHCSGSSRCTAGGFHVCVRRGMRRYDVPVAS